MKNWQRIQKEKIRYVILEPNLTQFVIHWCIDITSNKIATNTIPFCTFVDQMWTVRFKCYAFSIIVFLLWWLLLSLLLIFFFTSKRNILLYSPIQKFCMASKSVEIYRNAQHHTLGDSYISFDPSNAFHWSQGFLWPNLVGQTLVN